MRLSRKYRGDERQRVARMGRRVVQQDDAAGLGRAHGTHDVCRVYPFQSWESTVQTTSVRPTADRLRLTSSFDSP